MSSGLVSDLRQIHHVRHTSGSRSDERSAQKLFIHTFSPKKLCTPYHRFHELQQLGLTKLHRLPRSCFISPAPAEYPWHYSQSPAECDLSGSTSNGTSTHAVPMTSGPATRNQNSGADPGTRLSLPRGYVGFIDEGMPARMPTSFPRLSYIRSG